MFIIKNVNCKKTLKVFSEGKVTDNVEHLIAEYALEKQNTKMFCFHTRWLACCGFNSSTKNFQCSFFHF